MHSNEKVMREGYAAFGTGDVPAVLSVFDPKIVWTVCGHNSLSGVYTGHDEVAGFFGKLFELSGGTFALNVKRMIADDDGVVVIVGASGQRDGQSYSWEYAHVWEMAGGKATTFAEYTNDGHAEDALFA